MTDNDKQPDKPAGKSANENVRPICSICGNIYTRWGHNAQPVNDGRCCDDCNTNKVLPARITRMKAGNPPTRRRL